MSNDQQQQQLLWHITTVLKYGTTHPEWEKILEEKGLVRREKGEGFSPLLLTCLGHNLLVSNALEVESRLTASLPQGMHFLRFPWNL